MQVYCLYCVKSFSRPRGSVDKYNHNFCCREHYVKYRRQHPEEFSHCVNHDRDFTLQAKLKKMANDKLLSDS